MIRRALLSIITAIVAVQLLAGCFGVGYRTDPATGRDQVDPTTGEKVPTTPAEDGARGAAIGGAVGGPEGAALGALLMAALGIVIRSVEKRRIKKQHTAAIERLSGHHPTIARP